MRLRRKRLGKMRHKTDRSPLIHRFGSTETRRLGKWEDREDRTQNGCAETGAACQPGNDWGVSDRQSDGKKEQKRKNHRDNAGNEKNKDDAIKEAIRNLTFESRRQESGGGDGIWGVEEGRGGDRIRKLIFGKIEGSWGRATGRDPSKRRTTGWGIGKTRGGGIRQTSPTQSRYRI